MDEVKWKERFSAILEKEGNDFIQFQLDAGLDVNAKNKYGKTLLSNAAECGNLKNIEYLVQKGADGNVKNSDGSKPLHIAAKYGRKEIVEFFLDLGIPVGSCDDDKSTPLHYAAAKIDILLAARDTYEELVRLLLDREADINAVNRDGNTPLLLAARNRRKHIVKHLIELGADVNCCCENQWNVLHHSSWHGWSWIVQTLLEGRSGIDLNAKTLDGQTALIIAASRSYKEVFQLLIEAGADVECRPLKQISVLHFACGNGWLDVVKSLLAKGFDINDGDYKGLVPLLWATHGTEVSVVEYLIEAGADVHCVDEYEFTVLHYACAYGWLDVVKCLVEKETDLNAFGHSCYTPLHISVLVPDLKLVEHMLKSGADCNLKNHEGETALNLYIQCRPCLESIVLFLENGACLLPKDYAAISEMPPLKEGVLQDVKLCTQAVVNQFNNADLPKIYKIPVLSKRLPPIGNLKIVNNGNVAHDIAQRVKFEIQTKGYCNVLNVGHPGTLKVLCVKSLVENFVS